MLRRRKVANLFLGVDIGKGTQDIVVPDFSLNEENWPKAILPSPTEKLAKKVAELSGDIGVCGYVMGGGPVKRALVNHLKRGFSVRITEKAARTIRDDIDEVKRLGFEVVDSLDRCDIYLSDLETETYQRILWSIDGGLELSQFTIGIACQDHGFVKGQSDRVTRFRYLRKLLERERRPERMVVTERTGFFTRFDSILEQLSEIGLKGFVMDSKIAAVAGMDGYAKRLGVKEFVVLDVGNGHTLGASVKEGEVVGLFEHHTKMLDGSKLKLLVGKLVRGELSFEEVFEDGGHGAVVFEKIEPERVFVVGPNRRLAARVGEEAYPLGDAMLYGCAGLVEAFRFLTSKD